MPIYMSLVAIRTIRRYVIGEYANLPSYLISYRVVILFGRAGVEIHIILCFRVRQWEIVLRLVVALVVCRTRSVPIAPNCIAPKVALMDVSHTSCPPLLC